MMLPYREFLPLIYLAEEYVIRHHELSQGTTLHIFVEHLRGAVTVKE